LNKSDNDTPFDDNSSIGSADNADLRSSLRRLDHSNITNINLFKSSFSGSLTDLKDNMMIDNNNNAQNT